MGCDGLVGKRESNVQKNNAKIYWGRPRFRIIKFSQNHFVWSPKLDFPEEELKYFLPLLQTLTVTCIMRPVCVRI